MESRGAKISIKGLAAYGNDGMTVPVFPPSEMFHRGTVVCWTGLTARKKSFHGAPNSDDDKESALDLCSCPAASLMQSVQPKQRKQTNNGERRCLSVANSLYI